MRKKTTAILLVGTLMLSLLTGCGAGTKATEQEADTGENNDVVATDGVAGTADVNKETEDTGISVGAEDDNIVLYAEIAEYGEYSVDIFDYVEQPGTVNATEDILIYNDEGINVGYIKTGATIEITEGAEVGGWARFENPIAGTDYDYLYVLKDFVTDPEEIILTAETMKQGIEDFIVKWAYTDVDVTPVFLEEKASDMEMYECRMDFTYSDKLDYEDWFLKQFVRKDEFCVSDYETFYVECEEDTDGWIICRVYYKDPIDFGY